MSLSGESQRATLAIPSTWKYPDIVPEPQKLQPGNEEFVADWGFFSSLISLAGQQVGWQQGSTRIAKERLSEGTMCRFGGIEHAIRVARCIEAAVLPSIKINKIVSRTKKSMQDRVWP